MNAELKQLLETGTAEALAKERKLWALHQETEKWAAPAIKRFEESRAAWCDQLKKLQLLEAMLRLE